MLLHEMKSRVWCNTLKTDYDDTLEGNKLTSTIFSTAIRETAMPTIFSTRKMIPGATNHFQKLAQCIMSSAQTQMYDKWDQ